MTATAEGLARWRAERAAVDERVRRQLDAAREAGRLPPHPAPEVPCRLAVAGEMGRDALRLQRAAQAAGWTVQATYARGWGVHGTTGRPTAKRQSVAARCWGPDGRRMVAVWSKGCSGTGSWSCDLVLTWGPDQYLRRVKLDLAFRILAGTVDTESDLTQEG